MKTKEAKELQNKSIAELEKIVSDKKRDLEKVLLDIIVGKEKNLKKGKNLRHEIARVLTIISNKKFIEAEKKEN